MRAGQFQRVASRDRMSVLLLDAAAKRGLMLPPPPHDAVVLGELAASLFLRSNRDARRMPREITYLTTAERHTFTTRGGAVVAWEWGAGSGANRPLVALVHGWGGHGAQLGAFAQPLVEAGFRVLTFDSLGHGESAGDETHVPLVAQTLVELAAQSGPFHALIGHSMGAAAAAMYSTDHAAPRGLVLLAPPLSQLERVTRVANRLQLTDDVRAVFFSEIVRRTGKQFAEVDMCVAARRAPCPLLVLHDPADPDASFAGAEQIVALWQGARLVPCPGRGHYRILTTPDIVRQAVEFIGGLR